MVIFFYDQQSYALYLEYKNNISGLHTLGSNIRILDFGSP